MSYRDISATPLYIMGVHSEGWSVNEDVLKWIGGLGFKVGVRGLGFI